MLKTKQEVLEYVKEREVRFVRLTFFDLFGGQKNVSILPDHLESAFERGVAIDASLVEGFSSGPLDLFLVPDPGTFSILPWRSSDGYVVFMICDIQTSDGKPYPFDMRYQLKQVIQKLNRENLEPLVASKMQFTLFSQEGFERKPIDNGTYLDVSPQDQGENIRRDIMLTLEEMGCSPYKSFHQRGYGQNEIDFRFCDALRAADEVALLRWITRTMAHASGMEADFAPLKRDMNAYNSLQIQIKFFDENQQLLQGFLAGILQHANDLFFFLNPFEDSYDKFQDSYAPRKIEWSSSRYASVRISEKYPDIIEVRLADPRSNPYLVLSLLFLAGLDGIRTNQIPRAKEEEYARLATDYLSALRQSQKLDEEVFASLFPALKNLWRGNEA